MKKMLSLALALLMVSTLLAGCGSSNTPNGEVNVLNWGEYISDGEDDTMDVIKEFEEQTGIKVNYKVCSDNETLYSNLKQGDSYDVIIPSDYMISRLIEEGMLQKLNFDNIPNFSDVMDNFVNPEYDPTNEYSVPYMWGTVGIIYNTSMISDSITSWSALFDTKYAGQVLMINNSRDAIGVALKYLGYSYNTTDTAELQEAIDLLAQQKADGIVQAKVMDEIFGKMENGEAAIGVYYAGDFLTMQEVNPDLAFVVPSEGSNLFTDAMCIPTSAANKENAEKFINFMCSTDVGLANCEAIGYSTPLQSVYDALDEETRSNPVAYPPDEVLATCEAFTNLPQDILKEFYTDKWLKLGS
ncbi:spermidine/putrescine ABC transporter substrate-binding protein [Oscillibacter hominis]|uniref:Spermidine/putrescine ABC transporter substrate-binding protein n=2 Tax=Oscillibacter hominis TaxID=2763056 RepID=A0A7G9B7H4_9FIRM|nr:spermidine/putrescine ABC transporter substrate-binding protein [Oscillibacter hominis]